MKAPFRSMNRMMSMLNDKPVRFSSCLLFTLLFSACGLRTGVFEKTVSFAGHEWPSSVKPEFTFTISDTASLYNVFIVTRHSDAYSFNNLYVKATVREPGVPETKSAVYDLTLASNKAWIGTAMDDIYDARVLIQPKTKFSHPGDYHFTLEQLMREDPLRNMLNVGLRVEKAQ